MDSNASIFLVGPMGAGKSAVGRKLAEELGREFLDSDEVIESRTGVDIPYIFEREGESGFRTRERHVIEELTQLPGIVLATGGGAVQDPANREHLASRGRVVYLHATVDQQLKRTRSGRERPMLKGGDPREILEALMALRDPKYREIADFTIETDGRRVTAVTREIRRRLAELE
ncbi:MAG: shikimate kinase AroK [Gammaproteobacteria bacterium]|jgi:shikimate kinase|nr:shikimate kinase AroK [Gammaproteobacteria bacterium]